MLQVVKVNAWMAFVHGLLSFFTPCMFPLIPILLPVATSGGKSGVFGFSIGFVSTFAALGILPPFVKYAASQDVLRPSVSIFVITMGVLHTFGIGGKSGWILKRVVDGKLPSVLLGVGMGWIWMMCSTPVLASILSLLSLSESFEKGVISMLFYSAGILIPFLVFGNLISGFLENLNDSWKRTLRIAGGLILIAFGLYLL